jgi:uncharacterized protein Usg
MSGLRLQLNDNSLTTAEILYHLPDHPSVLQTYIWQQLDLFPKFPELRKFLSFWAKNLEGKLHSVRVANCELIQPPKFRAAHQLILH